MKNKCTSITLIALAFICSLSGDSYSRSKQIQSVSSYQPQDGEPGKDGYFYEDGQPGSNGQKGRNGQNGGNGGKGGNSHKGRAGNGGNGGDAE